VSGAIVLCATTTSPAQVGTNNEHGLPFLREVLHKSRGTGSAINALAGFRVTWVAETHWTPAPGDLERMRRRVRGHPDHPDLERLKQYERRLAEGPDTQRFTVWSDGDSRWRLNTDQDTGNASFADAACDGNICWRLTRGMLVVIDRTVDHPVAYQPDQEVYQASEALDLLVLGGFATLSQRAPESIQIDSDDKSWSIWAPWAAPTPETLTQVHALQRTGAEIDLPPSDLESRLTGTWWTSPRVPIAQRLVQAHRGRAHPEERMQFSGAHVDPVLGHVVYSRVEVFARDGQLDRVLRLEQVVPVDAQEVSALLRIPEPGGTDAIRGAVHVPLVADFRDGDQQDWSTLSGGMMIARAGNRIRITPGSDARERVSHAHWIRWGGWLIASSVITAIVAVALRRGLLVRRI